MEEVILNTGTKIVTQTPCELRWRDGVLEQRWWITEEHSNGTMLASEEWRSVPTVE